VGAWNVLSLREDDHLSLLSSQLKRLDIGIAVISRLSVWTTLRFGDRIAVRPWWVVIPTIGLVTLMITIPKELL